MSSPTAAARLEQLRLAHLAGEDLSRPELGELAWLNLVAQVAPPYPTRQLPGGPSPLGPRGGRGWPPGEAGPRREGAP